MTNYVQLKMELIALILHLVGIWHTTDKLQVQSMIAKAELIVILMMAWIAIKIIILDAINRLDKTVLKIQMDNW
jgi:hypothetical protein